MRFVYTTCAALLLTIAALRTARSEPPTVARNRLQLRFAGGLGGGLADGHGGGAATVAVGGSYAPLPRLEGFARVAARGTSFLGLIDYRGPRPMGSKMASGLAGARYIVSAGPWAVAPAVWLWTPAWGRSLADGAGWAALDGLGDARAFGEDFAVGNAIAGSWCRPDRYTQVAVGNGWVADSGPQIDNVFASVEGGVHTSARSILHGGVRVELLPTGAAPGARIRALTTVTVAVSRSYGSRESTWSLGLGSVGSASGVTVSYQTGFGSP